jgi:hypothetical protein
MSEPWTQQEAIALAIKVEEICPKFGCHVALTGGLLYKTGQRKDCDLLLYRIRQVKEIDFGNLWLALERIGLIKTSGFGWCYKCVYFSHPEYQGDGKLVDVFSPEEKGNYQYGEDAEIEF